MDPLVFRRALKTACEQGDVKEIGRLLDAYKRLSCVNSRAETPIMFALMNGRFAAANMLFGRGANLSKVCSQGRNMLHCAAEGFDIGCLKLVLANEPNIDINSTTNFGTNPIRYALLGYGNLDAGKLLVEKGANLFQKNSRGECAMDCSLGPQVLQHAKNMVWKSVKPLLLLSTSCNSDVIPFDPSIAIPSSLISVLGNSPLVRECIAPFFKRTDIIIRDPEVDKQKKANKAKRKAEEAYAAAVSSSSSSSSSKRARDD
jgi:ankyrin repeat protein